MIKYGNTYFFCETKPYKDLDILKDIIGDYYPILLENNIIEVKNYTYTPTFVGFISIESKLLVFLPKLLIQEFNNQGNDLEKILFNYAKTLFEVFKLFVASKEINAHVGDETVIDSHKFGIRDEIMIAEEILQDYVSHGYWFFNQRYSGLNFEGEIKWDDTIDSTQPLFNNYQPIYADTINESQKTIDNSIISRIHKWAVNYCHYKFGKLLEVSLNDINNNERLKDIGEVSILIKIIESQLNVSYTNRDIRLLTNLRSMLFIQLLKTINTVTQFGTSSFEFIWEDIISFLFSNQYSQYKELIPTANWFDIGEGKILKKFALKPDTIRWIDEDENRLLLIIDAKYYNFKFQGEFQNVPNSPDVTKQYFYEAVLTNKRISAPWNYCNYSCLNIFAFPNNVKNDELLKLDGFVMIDNKFLEKPILNVLVNINIAINRYIERKPLHMSEILLFVASLLTFLQSKGDKNIARIEI